MAVRAPPPRDALLNPSVALHDAPAICVASSRRVPVWRRKRSVSYREWVLRISPLFRISILAVSPSGVLELKDWIFFRLESLLVCKSSPLLGVRNSFHLVSFWVDSFDRFWSSLSLYFFLIHSRNKIFLPH